MDINTKGRYAVRIMTYLASQTNVSSVTEIALIEGISVKYLEKILSMLKKANLVCSHKGVSGGYVIARPVTEITLKDILDATDNKIEIAPCVGDKSCPNLAACSTAFVWNDLNGLISDFLQKTTLYDLLNNKRN